MTRVNAGRSPTTADVAAAAGVSRGTVSYALNGDPDGRLTEATRQKVLTAAAAIGYRPSAAARLLRGARSRNVLLLSPDLDGFSPLLATIVEGLARELALGGYSLVWQLSVKGMPRPVTEFTPALVLTAATREDDEFSTLTAEFSVPVVPMLPGRDEFWAAPGREQVRHLTDRGHTRVIYAAPSRPELAHISMLRENAVQVELAHRGLLPATVVTWPEEREASASLARTIVSRSSSIPGICAYNDDVALSVLAGAYDAGIIVPQRLAVVGADDSPQALSANPALSSTRSDPTAFVTGMASWVLQTIEGRAAPPVALPSSAVMVARSSS